MKKYAAVLFDLDGTLIDSLEDLADSANKALTDYGYKTHPVEAYKKFIGNGFRQLVKNACPEDTDESVIDVIFENARNIYNKNYLKKTCLYDNISDLLHKLEDMGIKMAVCSNKPDDFTNDIVNQLIGKDFFGVVFGERAGIPRKPDPAALLEAAGCLNVRPEETIYLGDSGGDMISAEKAGMLAAGALWGFRERQELVENGAKVLLSDPLELMQYIQRKDTP